AQDPAEARLADCGLVEQELATRPVRRRERERAAPRLQVEQQDQLACADERANAVTYQTTQMRDHGRVVGVDLLRYLKPDAKRVGPSVLERLERRFAAAFR